MSYNHWVSVCSYSWFFKKLKLSLDTERNAKTNILFWHFPVTASGHGRQSSAIKVIGIFLGKHYQAFHAVSSMCVGSLSWSQFVRVSASGGKKKEALPERRYSDVFYLSVKYIQRGGSLSKELGSMKWSKTHTPYWTACPRYRNMCACGLYMLIMQHVKANCT